MAEPNTPQNKSTCAAGRQCCVWHRLAYFVVAIIVIWAGLAYLVLPHIWSGFEHRHAELDEVPRITRTGNDVPGDPLNVALVGTKEELVKIMLAAKWYPADPLTLKSSLEIAVDAVFKRPDPDAPVSNLYLFGRKEDLAFEQAVGDSPRHRHHVRFWKVEKPDESGRPIWIGSAVYDERVGLSERTGQITHVTSPNVDAERDYLFECLQKTGKLIDRYAIDDFHKIREGRNGGGDPWKTDGKLYVGIIAPADGK